ncbi:MAG: glycoside hydrolase family 1 protein [Candidatus Thorarchaeota archaeon]|nr:MAG: glycoside hydrolase family 1 protein [Candidatus Thorarchaeota archaeon]
MGYKTLKFPKGFLWGSAASAHQTEGGNHNDWTEWERIPGKIKDGTNSSVACDHYHRYEEDFDLAKELGHQVHRFSVEWSRIEPDRGKWDEREVDHYRAVTKTLVQRGIQPMVTLHHFTNPIWFRDAGAWLNPKSPDMFAPYCRKIAKALSEYDVIWNIINEPMNVVGGGYLLGEFPPGEHDYGKALVAAKHLLMAHGLAAKGIRETYDDLGLHQPQIAPVQVVTYIEPYDRSNGSDVELAEYVDSLYNQMWLQGVMTASIPEPAGDGSQYEPLENSADFIGVNYYSRMRVSSKLDFMAGEMPPKDDSLERCEGLDWEVYPQGYYPVIKSYWDRWRKPLFMTENGIGTLDDRLRCRYILTHLQQVHRAIQDGVDIRGYLVWSLTDNFEWTDGLSSHFGLIGMDYSTLKRTPRESAYMYREIIQKNGISGSLQQKYLGRHS